MLLRQSNIRRKSNKNVLRSDNSLGEFRVPSILAYYTKGQGLPSQRRNNASYFYHYYGLGSTKVLTDANKNVQSTTIYDAWGNILQSSGTLTNPYLYVGELVYYGDGDAGMYLLTQRWYSQTEGRFAVKDPWEQGVNLYVYARSNPLSYIDPEGTFCWHLLGDCIGTSCHGNPICPPAGNSPLAKTWKCVKEAICMFALTVGLCGIPMSAVDVWCAIGCIGTTVGFLPCLAGCVAASELVFDICLYTQIPTILIDFINCKANGLTPCLDNKSPFLILLPCKGIPN
ncbi:RHS repeat-associated core domain-containing protein [bacterium]|nr:RHS repeat-associated core domain-containing protein [bacterium]